MIQGEVRIIKIRKDGTEQVVKRIPPEQLVKPVVECDPFNISPKGYPPRDNKGLYTPRQDGTQTERKGFAFGDTNAA